MKQLTLTAALAVVILSAARAAEGPLPDKLIDVTLQHVKTNGPDADVAQFVATSMYDAAWRRRDEFAAALIPFLGDNDPKKVAGAVETLYRFRHYHPMQWIGDDFASRKENADFFAKLDQA